MVPLNPLSGIQVHTACAFRRKMTGVKGAKVSVDTTTARRRRELSAEEVSVRDKGAKNFLLRPPHLLVNVWKCLFFRVIYSYVRSSSCVMVVGGENGVSEKIEAKYERYP